MGTHQTARRSARARARRPAADGRTATLDRRALRLGTGARSVGLWSGAVHYWRLAREDWRPALEELAALGLPIVETYAPWGVHEIGPGEFDFGERDPRKNLAAFLDLAGELGLMVFLRPGPHINAELTYFGIPERVVYDKACQARSPRQNPVILSFPPEMFPVPSYASRNYHREVGRWFDAVGAIAAPRIWPDGPIVLLQVDNEASYYFRDDNYEQDYHPDAVALWKRFVEGKHGGLSDAATVHRRPYGSWDDVVPPTRFDARGPEDLPLHLDWAEFKEELITQSLAKMKRRMARAGMKRAPTVHNLPLGDGGVPLSVPAIDRVVDVVGLDYYHQSRQHRTIKRRTLYLAGTVELPYAPELGVGAPYWFPPLSHDDSLFTALVALAYGLRGFNLYMAVDRDRWYGAPIDSRGVPRIEAAAWKQLIDVLRDLRFHELERRTEVALMVPREYGRLSRATHLLGGVLSSSHLEAIGGTPVDGCSDEPLGFAEPIQVAWWRMLARVSDALTAAGIPYVYVDGETPARRIRGTRLLFSPCYEFVSGERWRRLLELGRQGVSVVLGPKTPTYDDRMRRQPFELPRGARLADPRTSEDAESLVASLVDELGLTAPFQATPAPVETAVHEDAVGPRVLFVMQPADAAVDARIETPGPIQLRDALTGETFTGGDDSVHVPLGPKSCRMLVVESLGATREMAGTGRHRGRPTARRRVAR